MVRLASEHGFPPASFARQLDDSIAVIPRPLQLRRRLWISRLLIRVWLLQLLPAGGSSGSAASRCSAWGGVSTTGPCNMTGSGHLWQPADNTGRAAALAAARCWVGWHKHAILAPGSMQTSSASPAVQAGCCRLCTALLTCCQGAHRHCSRGLTCTPGSLLHCAPAFGCLPLGVQLLLDLSLVSSALQGAWLASVANAQIA